MNVLGLPWEEWGETDVMLLMAAEHHDRLVCTCGCGQWEADAHDPAKADLWSVSTETCYVRRAIDTYVKANEPPNEAVFTVRLYSSDEQRAEDKRARYAEMRALMSAGLPAPAEADAEVYASGDEPNEQDGQEAEQ